MGVLSFSENWGNRFVLYRSMTNAIALPTSVATVYTQVFGFIINFI